MCSSPKINGLILSVYNDTRFVFNLADIAMLVDETNFLSINKKLNYYVKSGKLLSPRRGIYAKAGYSPEELACKIYIPSYISLEYVLQAAGVVFQYDFRITSISYLSRELNIDGKTYLYRKLKGELLGNTQGIENRSNINIATPERAFLDMLYLDQDYYFDNTDILDKKSVIKLLTIYNSKTLTDKAKKLLQNGRNK